MTKSYFMKTTEVTTPLTANSQTSFVSNRKSSGLIMEHRQQQHQSPNNWFAGTDSNNQGSMMSNGDYFLNHQVDRQCSLFNDNHSHDGCNPLLSFDMPPMAYMNGNGVRPVRRRHFSQQQTGGMDQIDDQTENGGTPGNDQKNGEKTMADDQKMKPTGFVSDYSDFNVCDSSSSASSSSSSSSSMYNNNELNNTNGAEEVITSKTWTNRLAKGIEKVLRIAKENHRLNCTELLIPHMLTTHIASDVIEMAECEPCGLRGCLLLISIEDNENDNQKNRKSNNNRQASNNINRNNSSDNGYGSPPSPPMISGARTLSSTTTNPNSSSIATTKFLGKYAIDNNVVPTFEVFLTLKRVEPSWFESLENRFFKKAPIILSEVYLLRKKKLYQPSSPIF